jgi:hypothetical protein
VTEQSKVDVYGDSAVVYGVFRAQSVQKGKTVTRRERFLDTWVDSKHTWRCVASVAVLIPSNVIRYCLANQRALADYKFS